MPALTPRGKKNAGKNAALDRETIPVAKVRLLVSLRPSNAAKGGPKQFLGAGDSKEEALKDASWVAQNFWFTHSVELLGSELLPSNKTKPKATTNKTAAKKPGASGAKAAPRKRADQS